jgi:polysaccharide biosynthesis/export protein
MEDETSIRGDGASTANRCLVADAKRFRCGPDDLEHRRRGPVRLQLESVKRPATVLMALVLLCCLASADEAYPAPRFNQSDDTSTQTGSSGSAVEHREQRYRLQSEDVLAILFALSPEFDQTVTVQPDGYINLLGAGDLQVRGLTIPGLVDALQRAYGNILNHPIVNVSLKDFQTPFFVVSGQVAKPGQFALRYQTTVFEAIALAGGLTPAGKSHIFLLRRSSAGWFKVTPLSLSDIVAGKRVEDALLQPGDMVYVPEKFITKFRTYVPYSFGFYTSPQLVF